MYKLKELKQKAIKAIKDHKLIFLDDVISMLPCSKTTFFNHDLNIDSDILDAINSNRVSIKYKLRKKWMASNNAQLNIALYKLCANDTELSRLASKRLELTTKKHERKQIILVPASNRNKQNGKN